MDIDFANNENEDFLKFEKNNCDDFSDNDNIGDYTLNDENKEENDNDYYENFKMSKKCIQIIYDSNNNIKMKVESFYFHFFFNLKKNYFFV
jgi:hypothetical protein